MVLELGVMLFPLPIISFSFVYVVLLLLFGLLICVQNVRKEKNLKLNCGLN